MSISIYFYFSLLRLFLPYLELTCTSFFVLFAEFPHVKAVYESELKLAEEVAAKQVEENGLGIQAPLAGATIEEVNNWILSFKATYMEATREDKIPKFIPTIEKELISRLFGRVDQWTFKHNSKNGRYANFKSELRASYNETFIFC